MHRIRLLGPWDYHWRESPDSLAPPHTQGTVKMPCRWQEVFGPCDGTATFSRKFHCPTNLDQDERVFIVLTGIPGNGTAEMNTERLGDFQTTAGAVEFDVTKRLAKFNQLVIAIRYSPSAMSESPDGMLAEVALEIRSG